MSPLTSKGFGRPGSYLRNKTSGSTRARRPSARRRMRYGYGGNNDHLNPSDDGAPRKPYGWLIGLIILSLIITTLWFREAPEGGPLHGVRIGVQTVTTPLGAAGTWVTSPVRNFFNWAGDLGVSRSQLRALSEQNDELRARVIELEEVNLLDERLTGLMSDVPTGTPDSALLPATVIGLPSSSYEKIIVLNRGTHHGVGLAMPVVTQQGLLGVTIEVGPNYSKVRLITDQSSGVAALVQRGRHLGTVQGSLDGELRMNFVPVDALVEPGDVVLTSGLGGVFPKGLVLGEVIRTDGDHNTLYQSITVRSTANMDRLEEVLILLEAPPSIDNLPEPELPAPSEDGSN
ncbi:MAG: rod shape-determining protein MreC [Coriobacteriia bacterium]|nr:rod shape-determining protein MreC [Coriobacteriia bacterium]